MNIEDKIDELLVAALRNPHAQTLAGDLKQVAPADWAVLVQKAARHGIASALFQQLRTDHLLATAPAPAVQQLQQAYYHTAASNTVQYRELGQVLAIFQQHGITAIILKGTHLVAASNNLALRNCGDIDLLVRAETLLKASQLLQELGYKAEQEVNKITKTSNHIPALRNGRVTIELHRTIAPPDAPFLIEIDDLFQHSQPFGINNFKGSGLCPEDLLLHLCIHTAYQHCFDHGLRSIYDIQAAVGSVGRLDWEKFIQRSQQWQATKSAYLTLQLSKDLLNADVPDQILARLKPKNFSPALLVAARQQLFYAAQVQPFITHSLIQTWGATRVRDKVTGLLQSIFLPRKQIAEIYDLPTNSVRLYFYYLVRLRYLLYQHGSTLWQLWRGNQKVVTRIEREILLQKWLTS